MKETKDLIIFDLDGTLIDSVASLHKALNYMLKELNKDEISLKLTRDFIGNGANILVKRALVKDRGYEKYKIDDKLFQKALNILLDFYSKNLTQETYLYNGAKNCLEKLKNKNFKLAIATNKPYEFINEILEYFKIKKYFDYIIGAGVVEKKKPHPDMLLKVCKELKISPNKSIMIGDSQNDIIAAKNAKIDSIGVTWGYSHIDLKELNPNFICHNFKELEDILI